MATGAAHARVIGPRRRPPAPLARAIPSSGELLPAVGLGTAQVFNTNDEADPAEGGRGTAGAHRRRRPPGRYFVGLWRSRNRAGRGDGIGRSAAKAFHRHQTGVARRRGTQAIAGPIADAEIRLAAVSQRPRSAAVAGAVQGMEGPGRVPLYRHYLDPARAVCRDRSRTPAREAGFRADRLFAR